MIKLAILTSLTVAALPAMAAEYVLGRDYQPCGEPLTKNPIYGNLRDCTIPNTPWFYSDVYTDDDGGQRVREVQGKYLVQCTASRVCSAVANTTYEAGSFAGNGEQGNYHLTYRFYLGEDYNGNMVAYAVGRGPQFKEDPVGDPWANEAGGAPIAPGGDE